ncbi:MAG: MAPEG family protein [Pseudomonadota bacterium]
MDPYNYVVIVSALALLSYYFTLLMAGLARGRFKIEAPSHSGPPEYERYVRAHHNTLEHLVLFLPGLWLFAYSVSPHWAAAIGLIWPLMRVGYAVGYHRAPEKRLLWIYLSMPPIYIFVLGSLVSGLWQLARGL